MQDLYKNIFNCSPHPCICHKAVVGDDGHPAEFLFEASNEAFNGLFGTPSEKSGCQIMKFDDKDDFDWFSVFTSLWHGDKEICVEHYFPGIDRVMHISNYRTDDNIIVTWFHSLDKQARVNCSFRESRQLALLLESMPGIAVQGYGSDRIVHFWNKASEEMYGYSANEAIGKDIVDLIIPANMRMEVIDDIDKMIRKGEGGTAELLHLRHKDGTFKPVLSHHAVIEYPTGYKQLFCIDVDMLPYEKADEDIRKLSSAIKQSPVSIVITDTSGIIEYVNPVFCELTGYQREEVIGKNTRVLKSGLVSSEDYSELWETIKNGQIWKGELINRKKNGEHYFESVTVAPIVDSNGDITHFVGVKQDITEKKKFEQDLIDAREKARESDLLKAAFLQNMSHEIRTPMNAILGFSELAKMPGTTDEKRDGFLSIVIESTHRLLGVVDDIVDISRLETGNLMLKSNPIRLKAFMLGLYEIFKNHTYGDVVLEMPTVDGSLQAATVSFDSVRMKQILEKLLSNAVKFTKRGEIKFGCHKIGGAVRFFVEDTGIGISPDMYNLIFQPFYQLDMGATRAFGGNGLGLTIASRIVEKMGGQIHIDSKPGQGSVFYFDIWPDKSDFDIGFGDSHSFKFPEKREVYNILVAEDDEVNFILLREILKREFGEGALDVVRASTGNQAIEICRERANIDLILMDVKMPDVDGITATRQIKSVCPGVPIIAQTALAMSSDRDRMLAAGCDDYITKPIRRGLLVDLIYRYLRIKSSAGDANHHPY
ncbi:MAG: PAS domain S-box protein [Desulfobacteraceae bacterium]|jgi:PAS domain S-box-containing protein|nr:PAS domain S-box protein [Desulfobacteraceae bacterium]